MIDYYNYMRQVWEAVIKLPKEEQDKFFERVSHPMIRKYIEERSGKDLFPSEES